MAKLLGIPFSCSHRMLCVVCVIVMGSAYSGNAELYAQNTYAGCCPPYRTRDVGRPRVTYGGRIYLSFPNYDIFLRGAPTRLEDLATGAGVPEARVIYRNDQGMRFDGNEYFLHPAYPVEQITKYRIYNKVVGEGDTFWPQDQSAATTTAPPANYPTGYSTGTYYPTGTYPSASPTTTYQTAYPITTMDTNLSHSPMPNTVRFSGNAWGYEPYTHPAAPAPIYESPGAIITPPVTSPTGRSGQPYE